VLNLVFDSAESFEFIVAPCRVRPPSALRARRRVKPRVEEAARTEVARSKVLKREDENFIMNEMQSKHERT